MRNASGYQSENERQGKNRANRNTNISSIKRVNRNLKEVSHLVVQNNGMEMYKKACAARAKLLFLLIVVFLPFSLLGL